MRAHADLALDETDRPAPPAEPRRHGPANTRAGRARRRRTSLPWLRMMVVSAATVTVLVLMAERRERPEPQDHATAIPPAPLAAPPPVWQPVPRPHPLFAIEGIDRAQILLEVRRHVDGGREDTLSIGPTGEAGSARLRLTRNVPEPESRSFYVDLVRQAAEAGLSVLRSTQAAPLPTKFGIAEAADVTLMGETEQGCLAIRLLDPEMPFALRGWLCGSPLSEAQLTCLIDRLVLVGNEEPALKSLFAEAERRRLPACAPPARVASAKAEPRRR